MHSSKNIIKVQHQSAFSEAQVSSTLGLEKGPQFFVVWRNGEGKAQRGPLQVLWDLIASYQLDIFNVSLERISQDFLEFIRHNHKLQLDTAAAFTHMASRLIYYKSKALLPRLEIEEDEERDRLPPELVDQLLEYRKYQIAAEKLRVIEETVSGMYTRQVVAKPQVEGGIENSGEEWLDVNLTDLIILYSRLLRRKEKQTKIEKPEDITFELDRYSLEVQLLYLENLLGQVDSFSFQDIFENPKDIKRGELIVTFLAILELTHQSKIVIRQKNNFGEIRIFKRSVVVS